MSPFPACDSSLDVKAALVMASTERMKPSSLEDPSVEDGAALPTGQSPEQEGTCRQPPGSDDLSPAGSSAHEGYGRDAALPEADQEAEDSDDPIPPDALDQKFEDDFEQHVKKSNRKTRMALGAVGAGLGAGLGFLAAPVLGPGLVIAGIAGSAGGYGIGKIKGRNRLQKHGAKGTMAGSGQQRPTLRRLRFLVRWGHWQLLEYEDSPEEWRAVVLIEVVRAFSQWVQAMFLVRARLSGNAVEADSEALEIFQHLAPLYRCLQRHAFCEATAKSCSLVETAIAKQAADATHADLCRIAFPTILETISIMDRLAPSTHAKLAEAKEDGSPIASTSKRRSKKASPEIEVQRPIAVEKTQGRQRLRKIVDEIRGVLEQPHVKEALANPKTFERALDCADVQQAAEASLTPREAESADPDASLPRHSGSATSDSDTDLVISRKSSSKRPSVQLVVPPEGVEEELNEFHSCSEDEDAPTAPSTPSSGPGSPASAATSSTAPARGSSDQPAAARFSERLAIFSRGQGAHHWDVADEKIFNVRSATYLKDKKKRPSAPPLFELVNVDFIRLPPSGPIRNVATRRGFYPVEHRKRNDGKFLLIQNWVFPPYQAIFTSAVDPNAQWLVDDTPQARSWRKFLDGSIVHQKTSWKIIMSVEKGPWLVRRAVPKKPLLVGKALKMETRHEPGEYLELLFDVAGSKADEAIVGMVLKATSSLDMVLAMMVEGKEEEELPENLLVCLQFTFVDIKKVRVPDESWDWD
jgi:hypothetical protein